MLHKQLFFCDLVNRIVAKYIQLQSLEYLFKFTVGVNGAHSAPLRNQIKFFSSIKGTLIQAYLFFIHIKILNQVSHNNAKFPRTSKQENENDLFVFFLQTPKNPFHIVLILHASHNTFP